MPNLLRVQSVSREFGGLRAVHDVTFDVAAGETVGLIGPNGAGKTTLFNLLTGIYPLSSGLLEFDGTNLRGYTGHKVTQLGIARTFQNPRLFDDLTVEQHVVVALPQGRPRLTLLGFCWDVLESWKQGADSVSQILEIVGLQNHESRLAAALPYGKRRLVEIARCLATNPRLLLLDEPSAGLNEAETDELAEVLEHLVSDRQITLIVIEHDIGFVRRLCPRLLAMSNGLLTCDGETREVLTDPEVVRSYLGDD